MLKNGLGKNPHTWTPDLSTLQVLSLLMQPHPWRKQVWARGLVSITLVMKSYSKKGHNLVTCLLSSLRPLVWSQHDPKMSGGGWWKAMETWPHHYRNCTVVALGGATAKSPSYFEEPDDFFPVLQGYIPTPSSAA